MCIRDRYFRVHEVSCPEPHILRSITDHATGRAVFAQLIGEPVSYTHLTLPTSDLV